MTPRQTERAELKSDLIQVGIYGFLAGLYLSLVIRTAAREDWAWVIAYAPASLVWPYLLSRRIGLILRANDAIKLDDQTEGT